MTKHLHDLATKTQAKLISLAEGAVNGVPWVTTVPRILLDTWATLYRWHASGEAIVRITEEQEGAMLERGLAPSLILASAPLRHAAIACQLPDRSEWIVLARHAAHEPVRVHGSLSWADRSPLLTYVTEVEDDICAGYLNLRDQPTPAALHLLPMRSLRADGTMSQLTEAEITEEDYRLSLALITLFRSAS